MTVVGPVRGARSACLTTSPSPKHPPSGNSTKPTRPEASHLYRSAMRIGRDHIASTVNASARVRRRRACPSSSCSPPQTGVRRADVVTEETVAAEVVRTLVGSVG